MLSSDPAVVADAVVVAGVIVPSVAVVSAALVVVPLSDTAGASVPVPHPERSKAAAAAKDISFDVFLISDLRYVKIPSTIYKTNKKPKCYAIIAKYVHFCIVAQLAL